MAVCRYIALGIAAVSTAAMLYVGFTGAVSWRRLIYAIFADRYIAVVLCLFIVGLLAPAHQVWFSLLDFSGLATLANIVYREGRLSGYITGVAEWTFQQGELLAYDVHG